MFGLALVGFMAAGKSTLGAPLAQALGLGFVDLDEAIVQDMGTTIPELFARDGEAHFRAVEARVLRQVLALGPEIGRASCRERV